MPSTGVVDAFKNLIRHGKNHHSAARPQDDAAHQAPHSSAQSQQSRAAEQQSRQQRESRDMQQQQAAKGSPKYKEHIEQIVQEEREAKGKLPVYKGLEHYKLLEKMGDGAFSNVYKAIDLRSGQKIAVKVVRKYELSASQAGEKHLNREFKKKPRVTERANILKEVQIMRGINHPSIVKLQAFFESPEHYFLVLELMEGGELFHQIVKLTYFSENLARHVILQVAQGIRHLHEERGVVHRDIKPENLLFERIPFVPSKNPAPKQFEEDKEDEGEFIPGVGGGGIGKVKIADFGLSKVVWDEQTMTPCGTVGYTAPEIVKDERYSKSIDMWALGCVLYTLLCGFPPFYDESINVLTEKVARGYYTFLSPWWDNISPTAKDLITHLLCVDPAQRFTIDEFLAHPWITAQPEVPQATPLHSAHRALDSPLLAEARGGAREARSPGIATLKEAFDITYAVHRMEEEGARRRAQKGGANRGFLQNLNESDEEEEKIVSKVPPPGAGAQVAAKRAVQPSAYDGRAGQRDRGKKAGGPRTFELDMDGATLLGRRHKRAFNGGVSNPLLAGSPLKMTPQDRPIEVPLSPMRVD
ncbi:Pkinase-domain-containing protein [Epithele typhae]|uniref:Pkinase-domain-containing protein n=1 Tax=Epithele typhae TaxID=378194 RepID=UPI00200765F3|nr:Pkinase-domain-containing protein [Epithele typhae]KAH9921488.1 Pkinase-domain-containing protein [Epithele typhae]